MAISILLVDDHQLILDGIEAIITDQSDFELVGKARNGSDALKLVKALNPNIVLMDVDMPVMNGLEATSNIKKNHPDVSVIILSMHGEASLVKKIISYGANGYVLKNADTEELIEAIHKVAEGRDFFSPQLTKSLLNEEVSSSSAFQQDNPNYLALSNLTEREIEILRLIAEGYSNKEIGEKLFISHRTVDTHRTNLMKKLDVRNIAGLIKFSINNGLTE